MHYIPSTLIKMCFGVMYDKGTHSFYAATIQISELEELATKQQIDEVGSINEAPLFEDLDQAEYVATRMTTLLALNETINFLRTQENADQEIVDAQLKLLDGWVNELQAYSNENGITITFTL